jgi:hypothetical protein
MNNTTVRSRAVLFIGNGKIEKHTSMLLVFKKLVRTKMKNSIRYYQFLFIEM